MTLEEILRSNFGNITVRLPIFPRDLAEDKPGIRGPVYIEDSSGAVIMDRLHSWQRAHDICLHINLIRAIEIEENDHADALR